MYICNTGLECEECVKGCDENLELIVDDPRMPLEIEQDLCKGRE